MLQFEVAGPPQAWQRAGKRGGQHFTPAKTRHYQHAIKLEAQHRLNGQAPLQGPVWLDVTAVFPVPASWPKWRQRQALAGAPHARKPDGDNILKNVKDALNGVAYRDDAQVAFQCVRKGYGERPRLEITVKPMEEPQ